MSNSSFSNSVFRRLVLQTRKNQGLFGRGLKLFKMFYSFGTILEKFRTFCNFTLYNHGTMIVVYHNIITTVHFYLHFLMHIHHLLYSFHCRLQNTFQSRVCPFVIYMKKKRKLKSAVLDIYVYTTIIINLLPNNLRFQQPWARESFWKRRKCIPAFFSFPTIFFVIQGQILPFEHPLILRLQMLWIWTSIKILLSV